MLSLNDYLLTKLNEECIELADVAIRMNASVTGDDTLVTETEGEINDTLAVIEMLYKAGILPNNSEGSHKKVFKDAEFATKFCTIIKCLSSKEVISVLTRQITLQSLATAKMASKCMVFGLNEIFVGQTLHNTARLNVEVVKLRTLIHMLIDALPEIQICAKAKKDKRAKMLKFMPISVEQGAVDPDCITFFNELMEKIDH